MSDRRVTGFQRLGAATVGFTLVLVALGGAVRATGSGLACPDWPFCYGEVLPGRADIPPETGYALWNVWLEHTHRTVASLVGVLALTLAVWAVMRYRRRAGVVWPALAALVLVTLQAGLGALVVLGDLRAELVTAHLGLAMLVVACLVVVTVAASPRPPAPAARATPPGRGYARAATGVTALAFAQILIGGHVTGIGAGLAFTDFPLMDGAVIPVVDTQQEAFHAVHRVLAYALAVGVVYLWARGVRYRREAAAAGEWRSPQRWLVRLPMWATALVVVQIGLGVANLATRMAPAVVAAHLAVASLLWTALVVLVALAYRWARTPTPSASRSPPRQEPPPRQEAMA